MRYLFMACMMSIHLLAYADEVKPKPPEHQVFTVTGEKVIGTYDATDDKVELKNGASSDDMIKELLKNYLRCQEQLNPKKVEKKK